MKQKILFSFLITLLAFGGALYVDKSNRDRHGDEAVPVMADMYDNSDEEQRGLTFTDLAQTVNSAFNGEVSY